MSRLLAVGIVTLVLAGCSGKAPSSEALVRGERVFADSGCAACHGDRGEGVEGLGPALRDLAAYWDADRLSSYVRNPEAYRAEHPEFEDRRTVEFEAEMPASGHLSPEELRALTSWLLTR